jgi:tRNA nucleotidyltransferase (CCA-adding enzyme)
MNLNLNPVLLRSFRRLERKIPKGLLYLVGGVVRDSLLGRPTLDLDVATPLPPEEVHAAFPRALYFPRYGTSSFRDEDGVEVTVASFRTEKSYADYRHPQEVTFVRSLEKDARRRDFTVNDLYAETSLLVLDPSRMGLSDLENRILRAVGDPQVRFQEDPLRLLRAYRFSAELGLRMEEKTKEAYLRNLPLVRLLNPQKIREEVHKAPETCRQGMIEELHLSFAFEN